MRAGPIAHVVLLLLASSMVAWAAPGVVVPPGEEEMTPEKAEAIKQAKALLASLKNRTNRTARTRADNDEMLARVISLVIHDASMVRLQNTEPNRSEDCTWPSCAAYCAPCAKTNQYWTCFTSGTQCQENSECVMGACFAEPGYCYADAYPQIARCWMGATPEKANFYNSVILRLGAAPPVPLPEATYEEWMTWANSCAIIPFLLFIFSLFVAYKVCWVIDFSKGDQCDWLPRTRHGIIVFSVFCLIFFLIFQVIRFFVVRSDIRILEGRMDDLQRSMHNFQELTDELVSAEHAYNQSLVYAPDSCGEHNPLATQLVQLLADALEDEFMQVDLILEIVRETLDTAMVLLARGKTNLHSFGYMLIYYPIYPAVIMLLGMACLLCIAGFAWNRPKVLINPYFRGALNMLSPCILIFVLFCGICASLCFYISMLITGYCLNIDDNLQVASSRIKFHEEVAEKVNVEPILQHTAAYYLQGVNVNPMGTLLQNFEAALYTVKRLYEMFEWLVHLGDVSCPGLVRLSPVPLLKLLLETTADGYDFISAKNIWPYYSAIAHKTVCHHFPRNGMGLVFICILIGFIFCPLIAITISNHLKHARFGLEMAESTHENEKVSNEFGTVGVMIQSRLSELSTDEQELLLKSLHQDVLMKKERSRSSQEVDEKTSALETDSDSGDRMC